MQYFWNVYMFLELEEKHGDLGAARAAINYLEKQLAQSRTQVDCLESALHDLEMKVGYWFNFCFGKQNRL